MFDFNFLLKEIDIELSDKQLKQFSDYYHFLIEYNEKVNLTAITEEEDVYIKHFYDSILVSKALDLSKYESLCDVGSGAGFPSIPLKILYPHLKITIIDSLDKRLTFLKQLTSLLGLDNVTLIHQRAEEYKEGREQFDLVTARAVAKQAVVNELCLPLVKVNGYFISMKSKGYEEELEEGNSLNLLDSIVESIKLFNLPNDNSLRAIILIKKNKKTALKYPRPFAKIKNKSL